MITKYQDKERYISSIQTDRKWKEILFLNLMEVSNNKNRVKIIPKQVNLSEEDKKELLEMCII